MSRPLPDDFQLTTIVTEVHDSTAWNFVLAIKSECLDKMILFGEKHLRYVIENHVSHCAIQRTALSWRGRRGRPAAGPGLRPGASS